MDLYRLQGKSYQEFEPLDFPRVFSESISLVEWPGRLEGIPEVQQFLPPAHVHMLKIDLRIVPASDERIMTISTCMEGDFDGDTSNDGHVERNAPPSSSWKDRLQHLVDEGMVDDLILPSANFGRLNDD